MKNNHSKQITELLSALRTELSAWKEDEQLLEQVRMANQWFIQDHAKFALSSWIHALETSSIEQWLSEYPSIPAQDKKKVGIAAAGNIPLVGLHDVICAIAAGHQVLLKLSKDDEILMKKAVDVLGKGSDIQLSDRLNEADVFIATGSNNTARYFEYYFRNKASIIRKNRTSVAVIHGHESMEELRQLAFDVYAYFGLGCRNVSKIFIPNDFDITRFIDACEGYSHYIDHHKYANNYIYHKAIFLMNQTPHLDNGFMLFKEDKGLHAPLSVLFYEKYSDQQDLSTELERLSGEIQVCMRELPGGLPFGTSQQPGLSDYADNMDVMEFLLSNTGV